MPIIQSKEIPSGTKGYQMLSKIEINNFRCYKKLELKDLGRFNFIVGDNGTGKSSLLDAIYLCAGSSPEILIRTMMWRGLVSQSGAVALSTDTYKEFFSEIFHAFKTEIDVDIRFIDSYDELRWLKITYGDQREVSLPLTSGDIGLSKTGVSPLTFKAGIGDKEIYNTTIELADSSQVRFKSQPFPYNLSYLNALNTFAPQNLTVGYSRIDSKNRKDIIIRSVQNIFPEIDDISSIYHGGTPLLGVASKYIPNKIPVGSYSAGMTKFLHIIIAIENSPKNVVLIDEIDNGLYYGKIEAYMREIVKYCERNNTQIFASTHSMEFLRTLLPIMVERSDFCLLKAERASGVSTVKVFDSKHFEAALELGAEIR